MWSPTLHAPPQNLAGGRGRHWRMELLPWSRRSARPVVDQTRLLYLIGQFPAINHSYLLAEVRHLRRLGFDVSVASVSPPDRPLEELNPDEREETARTYYVKSVPAVKVALLNTSEFLRHPLRYLRGLFFALKLGRSSPSKAAGYTVPPPGESKRRFRLNWLTRCTGCGT
jgi:hypothetical protein